MIKLKKSALYDAAMYEVALKLSSLVIEAHNTARLMSERKCDLLEIQAFRSIADAISSLETSIRNTKYNQ